MRVKKGFIVLYIIFLLRPSVKDLDNNLKTLQLRFHIAYSSSYGVPEL